MMGNLQASSTIIGARKGLFSLHVMSNSKIWLFVCLFVYSISFQTIGNLLSLYVMRCRKLREGPEIFDGLEK